jgi:hypothetical protein
MYVLICHQSLRHPVMPVFFCLLGSDLKSRQLDRAYSKQSGPAEREEIIVVRVELGRGQGRQLCKLNDAHHQIHTATVSGTDCSDSEARRSIGAQR